MCIRDRSARGSVCFFQAEDGIRDVERSRGLGDVYKRQEKDILNKPGKKSATKSKKSKILTDNDIMKYEIASELGLIDKVTELGWAGLTAKEAGKIGGMLTSRKKQKKKAEEAKKDDGTV